MVRDFKSLLRELALIACAAVAVLGITLLVATRPTLGGALAAMSVLVLVTALRPHWLVHLFLIAAFLTMPGIVPPLIEFSGVGFYLYEPFLYLAVAWLLLRRGRAKVPALIWIFALAVAFITVLGLVNGHDTAAIVADTRPLFDLAVAAAGAYLYLRAFPVSQVLVTTRLILWVSMVLTGMSSLGLIDAAGRAEANVADATRIITASTYFALAVLTLSLAALASGASRVKIVLPFIAPAVLILLVAFSRNTILAVGVAVVWATLAAPDVGKRISGGARLLVLTGAVGLIVAALLSMGNVQWLQDQVDGFTQRVLGGISNGSVLNEGRAYENLRVWPVILEAPLFGHGSGAVYKEAYGPADGFNATRGMGYVHNFYLWLALKGGILAIVAFAAMVLKPVVTSLRARNYGHVIVASALVAFCATSVVAPMPIGFPTAALFGILVGAAHHFASPQSVSTSEPPSQVASTRRRAATKRAGTGETPYASRGLAGERRSR